jgi:TonB family protein
LASLARDQNSEAKPAFRRRRQGANQKQQTKLSVPCAEIMNMNTKVVSKLAILLSLGGLAPFAVLAETPGQAYIETSLKGTDVPVPRVVVTPLVDPDYVGQTVKLEILVDATGRASEISVKSSPSFQLSDAVVDAVKQWEFVPAHVNGAAVAKEVLLPVEIVDNPSGEAAYALF